MDYIRTDNGLYLLKLTPGDDPVECLSEFAKTELTAGAVSGIGAVKCAEIGYFDFQLKKYLRKKFNGYFEMISLSGNIIFVDENPIVHTHIILGRRDCSTIGGHLFAAEISVTGEIIVNPFPDKNITRSEDDYTKLALWEFTS